MNWYVKAPDGTVFGPVSTDKLKTWADESRITPEHLVSEDRENWIPVSQVAELGMIFLIELKPGDVFGPFTQKVVENLVDGGEFPADAKVYVAQEMLASAMESAEALKNDLAAVGLELTGAKTELEAKNGEISSLKAEIAALNGQLAALNGELATLKGELEEKSKCIVIDPEVLEPEVLPPVKPVKDAPPKVSPLDNPASLEARLRNELIRARQKGMDFSAFLKKR